MMLLVDIGNTRVKWATHADGRLSPQRAAEHAVWTVADWQRELFRGQRIEDVLAATVAGDDSRRALEAAARSAGAARVEFVTSTAAAAGVRNAYSNPRLLGVDRWVAMIGAYDMASGACCVVDIGTAATLDAVDGDGTAPGRVHRAGSAHDGALAACRHQRPCVACGGEWRWRWRTVRRQHARCDRARLPRGAGRARRPHAG